LVRFENVGLRYGLGPEILRDLSFMIPAHSFQFLTGPSGAGKTSLLRLLFLSLRPTRGLVNLFGHDVSLLGKDEIADLRKRIGIVLQEESEARHSDYPQWVGAATAADWERLGRRYLERTARWQTRARFTDKGLSNWQTLGAIFAMLPGAKVVHSRRDPVETCWSCFKQLFPVGQPFTYDIAELATFHADYDRMMRFWHERYPGRIHDFIYEDLLADPDTRVRALLDYSGLSFEEGCLNFHQSTRAVRTPSAAQVRQPLRGDTARAPRYGELLDPLRAALRRAEAQARSR